MAIRAKTQLEKLQAAIDRCNNRNGCDCYCSASRQKECSKLRKHDARINYCMTHDIPIELW